MTGIELLMLHVARTALALGASAEELKPLTDEIALQKTKVQAVADAIAANSPAAP